ncbi:hypothetical protein E2C01_082363 [Portunus trituberculatus]|uniref:Uncharacterized protein n=1 Tax=Portunus trituberculatus TaxID=210409 RepID=A0A5B7IPR1_PORTR|nr:hypothetical protein [Portunus trituberculatus]
MPLPPCFPSSMPPYLTSFLSLPCFPASLPLSLSLPTSASLLPYFPTFPPSRLPASLPPCRPAALKVPAGGAGDKGGS